MEQVPTRVQPPAEAWRFRPRPDYCLQGSGQALQRFIFGGQALTPLEEEKLAELESRLADLKLPSLPREHLLRFCHGTQWNTEQSLAELQAHYAYQETLPADRQLLWVRTQELFVSSTQQTGALYVHGRDFMFRPIIVMNVARFDFNTVRD